MTLSLAHAQTPEAKWGYTVNILAGQHFPDFDDAETTMKLAATDPKAPWLARKGDEEPDSSGRMVTNYYIPPVGAEVDFVKYQSYTYGGPFLDTEAELVSYIMSEYFSGANICSANLMFTSSYTVLSESAQSLIELRDYEVTGSTRHRDPEEEAYFCAADLDVGGTVKKQTQ